MLRFAQIFLYGSLMFLGGFFSVKLSGVTWIVFGVSIFVWLVFTGYGLVDTEK